MTSAASDTATLRTGVIAVPTDEESRFEPRMTRWWGRRLWLQARMFGFASNRYVISDRSQANELHSLNEALPLRPFLVQALITMLLIATAVGIGWLW
ncbi:hypothetical protein A5686_20195 [Mycobacterium sp. E2479]|nr:hypothetical protein A5686_20195 [Mycobacterium sp. E2479]